MPNPAAADRILSPAVDVERGFKQLPIIRHKQRLQVLPVRNCLPNGGTTFSLVGIINFDRYAGAVGTP